MNTSGSWLVLLWWLGLAGSGCVMIDSTLTLEHIPAMDTIARTPHPVFLARVTDRRTDTGRIGCKKNGYGSESSDLFLDVSLTDWFGGVMNEELRRAGLRLVGPEAAEGVRVEIDMLSFFIEPEKSFFGNYDVHALVHAEVTVRFPDGSGYVRQYASHTENSSMLPTDGTYEEAMEKTVSGWMGQVVGDVVSLVEIHGKAGQSGLRRPGGVPVALPAGWRPGVGEAG